MKRLLIGTFIFVLILSLSGCFWFEIPYKRGELVSQTEEILVADASEMVAMLDDYLDTALNEAPITLEYLKTLGLEALKSQAIHDVKAYKITFKTIGSNDDESIQSGLVLLPVQQENTFNPIFPLIRWHIFRWPR